MEWTHTDIIGIIKKEDESSTDDSEWPENMRILRTSSIEDNRMWEYKENIKISQHWRDLEHGEYKNNWDEYWEYRGCQTLRKSRIWRTWEY